MANQWEMYTYHINYMSLPWNKLHDKEKSDICCKLMTHNHAIKCLWKNHYLICNQMSFPYVSILRKFVISLYIQPQSEIQTQHKLYGKKKLEKNKIK